MQLYVVGGAVRDALLGLPPSDRDWVAVGATPEELVALGYRPVGRDFPVFLHPDTGEEVALARTERKTAPGYRGFAFHAAPDVTLEDDLRRRDLTVNAIAQAEDGSLIDPHGGRRDLDARVLRHVSEAFVEDPVRLLRVARLAARHPDFTIAPETQDLMRRMVQDGEVDALVPERVWQELSRGLMTDRPSRMLQVLRDCGALARLLPEVDAAWSPDDDAATAAAAVDRAAATRAPLPVRHACLLLPAALTGGGADTAAGASARLRAPSDCRELAVLLAREHAALQDADRLDAAALVGLLERCDALRRPARFESLLQASACFGAVPEALLRRARDAAAGIDTATVAAAAAAAGARGPAVGAAVSAARAAAVDAALKPPS